MMRTCLAVAVAGFAFTNAASAHTLTYSFLNAPQAIGTNQTGSLGLFDPMLGTLDGVALALNGEAAAVITLKNEGAVLIRTVTGTEFVDLLFSSSLAGLNLGLSVFPTLSMTTGPRTLAPGATYTSPTLTDSDSLALTPAAALFLGSGSFDINCVSSSSQGSIGGLAIPTSLQAACGASITYTYTATPPIRVPEPDMLALLGIAVAGGALVARRRKTA